jgi:FAD/FMN-containing dehydrogenase
MKREQLREHPAYLALTPDEQAAIDERLEHWHLDAPAVAATTGGVVELDVGDLRFWLASTAQRPWAMVTLNPRSALADAIFEAMLAAAPDLAEADDRPQLVDLARDLSRALVVAEGARVDQGFVREEQLGAASEQIDALAARVGAWHEELVHGVLRELGLEALANELVDYARQHRGLRNLVKRARERASTRLFDVVRGGLFLATGSSDHEGSYRRGEWSDWTNSYRIAPASYLCPRSEDELCGAIASARKLRVVGGGHSFNDAPLCADRMISLDDYDHILELDVPNKRARVQAGIRLRDLNRALWAAGLGLPVLGSTDAQSVAGLLATDLHGTGRDHGFLSEQVLALRIIAANGEAQTVRPGDPLFHAAIGAIGTCGVVAEVELQLVDAFHLQKTTQMVDRVRTEAHIDELLAANEHVSFYYIGGAKQGEAVRMHRWNRTDAPLTPKWERIETRVELTDHAISAYFPKLARSVADRDEDAWLSDLLAPDRSLVMPGSRGFGRRLFYRHDEIEFGVPYERYQDCLTEILDLLAGEKFFSIVEVRFTPDRSQALLGPGVGRRTAYLELATPLSLDHERMFARAEQVLRAYGGQPHLGKKTNACAQDMLEIYGERFVEFQAIRARQDPEGKFLNPFTARVLG